MQVFFVADLTPQGELRQVTEYDYATLEQVPGAAELIARSSAELWKNSGETEFPLSDQQLSSLRWKATADTAGVATVRNKDRELVSISILAAGKDLKADATTIAALQQHLVQRLRQTPYEPAFDLTQINQRPLVATMAFASAGDSTEQRLQALADRAFAAAYFRFLGLA